MGRKSLAVKFYEELEVEDECNGTWIVLYDFRGIKPSSKFWDNIERLIGIAGNGSLIQYSAFMTENRRSALTMVQLAKHYGGKVVVFKGEQLDMESLMNRMHRTDRSGVLGRTETTNEP